MNVLIKTIAILWLSVCAVAVWVMCAFVGFIMLFTNIAFLSWLTPLIGASFVICIIFSIVRVKRSNPVDLIARAQEQLLG